MSYKPARGVVWAKTIDLTEDLGLADGEEVEVWVRVLFAGRVPGEGFLRSAGALADDPYWDGILEEIYQARKLERQPQIEDE
jgi:hypothetical protein